MTPSRLRASAVTGFLSLAATVPVLVSAQLDLGPIVRPEAGMLNAGDPLQVTLAYGGGVGWDLDPSNALLVRYVRQSQNRNSGADIGRNARGFLTANWEHAFGPSERYHRQAVIRVGAGALFRNPLKTAPVVSASAGARYPVHRRVAFVGSIEDDIGILPHQDVQSCAGFAPGPPACTTYTYVARLQRNFGFLVAAEWRP
jgi:hypothetical protein